MGRASTACSVLVAVFAASSCSDDGANAPTALEVGVVTAGEFVPFAAGSSCTIVDAVQGGFWVMPVLRVDGDRQDEVFQAGCRLVTDDGELLGDGVGPKSFDSLGDGFSGHQMLLFLDVVQTRDDYEALDGRGARLTCSLTAGDGDLGFDSLLVLDSAGR